MIEYKKKSKGIRKEYSHPYHVKVTKALNK